VLTSSLDVAPAWAALAGCLLLLVPRLRRRDVRLPTLLAETSPGFCLFVLALAVVVAGVTRHGLGHALTHVLPDGTGLGALLLTVLVAAGLANLVNNLPATLALIPLAAGRPALVLAVLLGVNIGPNLTYVGSLATLLWRRLLPAEDKPRAAEFHLLGVLTVPVLLMAATLALWASLQVVSV
jgi:arsenical pump membrane protein